MKYLTIIIIAGLTGCAGLDHCNKEPDGFEYCYDPKTQIETKRQMTYQEVKAKHKRKKQEAWMMDMGPFFFHYGAQMLQNSGPSRSYQPRPAGITCQQFGNRIQCH